MHKGSCLCGAVEYEIDGELGPIVYCHCSRCRKANGSAFAAISPVASSDFHIVKGQEHLRSYRSASGVHRVFCGICGSPIIGKRENLSETVRVPAGAGVPFYHKHHLHEELYLFLNGQGQFQIDEKIIEIREGTALRVSPDGERTWRNNSKEDLFYIVIQATEFSIAADGTEDGYSVQRKVVWPT
jgi:hypothetical protein